jgi:hypothetical protein
VTYPEQGFPPPPPSGPQYGNQYPPPGGSGHPVQLTIAHPQSPSRALAGFSIPFFLVRIVAAIPVIICLYFVIIVAEFAAWFGQWAVLFTGKYPPGLHKFGVGAVRWQTKTMAWMLGLTDSYPGFGLAP